MNISDIDNLEEKLASKAEAVHTHPTSDVTGLVEALAGKAEVDHTHDIADFPDFNDALGNFAPENHTHTVAQITDLGTALAGKANLSHTHAISSVTGLTAALSEKASTTHTHAISDVTNLEVSLNAKAATNHSHAIADVTNLQTSLDGKAASSHTHAISDIAGLSSALVANGNVQSDWTEGNDQSAGFIKNKPTLGTAAIRNVGIGANDVASGAHSHDASAITSGVLSLSRIPTIPGTTTIVSSGDLAALTEAQTDLIISGSSVVTSDGTRYVYRGSGDKKLAANYIVTSTTGIDTAAIVDAIGFASTLEGGLMSAADKTKLNGVAPGANNYVHPTGDGNLHVPATGVLNNNQVLTAGATAGSMTWKPLPAPYVHPNGDGDRHVPATGTVNGGKVLTAGATAGSFSWQSLPTTATPASHTHGNITNDGKIQNITSPRVLTTNSSGTIGALSATGTNGQVLTSKGGSLQPAWENAPMYVHPTGDGNSHVPVTGTTNNGKVLTAGATAGSFSWQSLPSTATPAAHTHGNMSNDGKLGDTAHRVVVTTTGGTVTQLNASGSSGQVLTSGGASSAPSWGAANNHAHGSITSDGKVGSTANRVLVTGTDGVVGALSASGASGQVLTSNGTSAPTWQAPAAATSVANISGGSAGQLLYQSAPGVTSKVVAGSSIQTQFLRSQGAGSGGPTWQTVGSIVFKNSDEYVATDDSKSVLKIQRISQIEYDALSAKAATTLYIIV